MDDIREEGYAVELEFGSELQKESVELREKILRIPLGLKYDREELARENNQWHLAWICAGKVKGILLMLPVSEDETKMRQVAVDSDGQRSGIGRRLVAFAEKLAIERGYRRITLHARDVAVPFYLKLGYYTYGEPFTEVGIKHYAMAKILVTGNW